MWLSTFILLPLGIFVTYKAMNDSSVFNPDLYKEWIRRRLGLPESRHVTLKEVIINDINRGYAFALVENLEIESRTWLSTHRQRPSYTAYWAGVYHPELIDRIGADADNLITYLSDSRDAHIIDALNHYPTTRALWILRPFSGRKVMQVLKWFAPIGIIFYLCALPYARRVYKEIRGIADANLRLIRTVEGLGTGTTNVNES